MESKSLLLDIDGVLLRDKDLSNHVRANCVRYVKSKVPMCKDPYKMNSAFYNTYGHTALGLQQVLNIDTFDFNHKVYDKQLINHLWSILSSTEFKKDATEIHSWVKEGWNIQLFTNSPIDWSLPVSHAISDEISIACDGIYLKPETGAYMKFDNKIKHTFVDDSLRNLDAVSAMSMWRPVHFSPNGQVTKYPTVGSISFLGTYLRDTKF
jgi:hypothetical protein